jgi:hypothetical protein
MPEGRFREQFFDHQLHSEVRSDGRRLEEKPACSPSPKGQRPYKPTVDRKYPTPFSTVFRHQPSTRPQTEGARISSERINGASSPINVEEVSSVSEEEGNSTLMNGTESDQICCEKLTQ